jgi:hypothetical protein
MDQRSVVLYLRLKGLSANWVHADLIATLGSKAVAYNMVTCDLREATLGTAEVILDPEASSPHLNDSDWVILADMEEKPFSSVRELVRVIDITRATVSRRLTKPLGFRRCLLRRVPRYRRKSLE